VVVSNNAQIDHALKRLRPSLPAPWSSVPDLRFFLELTYEPSVVQLWLTYSSRCAPWTVPITLRIAGKGVISEEEFYL
jgi:hypothetical protein